MSRKLKKRRHRFSYKSKCVIHKGNLELRRERYDEDDGDGEWDEARGSRDRIRSMNCII